MSVYDTYGPTHIQLKNGPRRMYHYEIEDDVAIPDGVYVGLEGVVVIIGGILAETFGALYTKQGISISLRDCQRQAAIAAVEEK